MLLSGACMCAAASAGWLPGAARESRCSGVQLPGKARAAACKVASGIYVQELRAVYVLSGAAQDFVMGTGLIPADGEIWKVRRRAIVPALHRCAPCA